MTKKTKSKNDSDGPSGIGWIFLLIGVGLLLGSALSFHLEATFEATAQSTSGTVIDLVKSVSTSRSRDGFSRSSVSYKPVVVFTDNQGRTQKMRSTSGSNPPAYKKGDQVTVLYDPDNQKSAAIDDWRRYGLGIILGCLGIFFAIFGSLFIWKL